MKVALCQMNIAYEDKKTNIARAEEFIKQAAEQGANIIIFPEMSMTGFSMLTDYTSESKTRTVTLNKFKIFASKYKIHIGLGWVAGKIEEDVVNVISTVLRSREGDDLSLLDSKDVRLAENHYTIIDENGDVKADYVKIHPFSFMQEDQHFVCGDEVVQYEIDGVPCSNFICYDLRFPEVFQAVADEARVIFVPACWPAPRINQWKMLLAARAIENQCYVIGVNCVGNQDGVLYTGESRILNPYGEVIARLGNGECLYITDIPDDVEQIRSQFPVRHDRRYDLYAELMSRRGSKRYVQELNAEENEKQALAKKYSL